MVHPKQDDHGKGGKGMPATTGVQEGSARRNINRKHDHHDPNQKVKTQHGGAGGKGKWNDMDDGSMMDDYKEVDDE